MNSSNHPNVQRFWAKRPCHQQRLQALSYSMAAAMATAPDGQEEGQSSFIGSHWVLTCCKLPGLTEHAFHSLGPRATFLVAAAWVQQQLYLRCSLSIVKYGRLSLCLKFEHVWRCLTCNTAPRCDWIWLMRCGLPSCIRDVQQVWCCTWFRPCGLDVKLDGRPWKPRPMLSRIQSVSSWWELQERISHPERS